MTIPLQSFYSDSKELASVLGNNLDHPYGYATLVGDMSVADKTMTNMFLANTVIGESPKYIVIYGLRSGTGTLAVTRPMTINVDTLEIRNYEISIASHSERDPSYSNPKYTTLIYFKSLRMWVFWAINTTYLVTGYNLDENPCERADSWIAVPQTTGVSGGYKTHSVLEHGGYMYIIGYNNTNASSPSIGVGKTNDLSTTPINFSPLSVPNNSIITYKCSWGTGTVYTGLYNFPSVDITISPHEKFNDYVFYVLYDVSTDHLEARYLNLIYNTLNGYKDVVTSYPSHFDYISSNNTVSSPLTKEHVIDNWDTTQSIKIYKKIIAVPTDNINDRYILLNVSIPTMYSPAKSSIPAVDVGINTLALIHITLDITDITIDLASIVLSVAVTNVKKRGDTGSNIAATQTAVFNINNWGSICTKLSPNFYADNLGYGFKYIAYANNGYIKIPLTPYNVDIKRNNITFPFYGISNNWNNSMFDLFIEKASSVNNTMNTYQTTILFQSKNQLIISRNYSIYIISETGLDGCIFYIPHYGVPNIKSGKSFIKAKN